MNYDPKTHVQAGELRRLGWNIPDSIPDVAHVPRWAIRFDGVDVEQNPETKAFVFRVGAIIVEPFRWIEGTYRVEK